MDGNKGEGMRSVFYRSTIRGITSDKGEEAIYCGTVLRIPSKAYGTPGYSPGEWEPEPESLLQPHAGIGGEVYEPIMGGTMERYETRDLETGDVLVLWRFPYRLKQAADEICPMPEDLPEIRKG